MKRFTWLFMVALCLLASCEKYATIVQTQSYNERSSGSLSITTVNAIVVQNPIGPVIIEGSSDTTAIGWFLNKSVTAESQGVADQVFSQIVVNMQTINDTAIVIVHIPSGATSYNSLLSLTVPSHIPCILRKVNGTSEVSYLQSTFVGESVASATIQEQQGNCIVHGGGGTVSIQISLPDSGLCEVSLTSGDITLSIPAATSSMLAAQTGHGTILYSALVIADSIRTNSSFTGKLGTGHGNIQLSTGTGNIHIDGF